MESLVVPSSRCLFVALPDVRLACGTPLLRREGCWHDMVAQAGVTPREIIDEGYLLRAVRLEQVRRHVPAACVSGFNTGWICPANLPLEWAL